MSDSGPGKVLLIGNRGRMGAMLEERAKAANLCVGGIDQPLCETELGKACADAEVALFCVPAANLEEVLLRVAPFLPAEAVVADITSVKEAPMRQMERHWQGAVVGTHPLFGPKPEDDLPVAITPGKNARESDIEKTEAFFQNIGCRVFRTDAASHDRAMAKIQNMNFITNLAYFAALAGQEDLLPFLTPSFQRRKQAAAKMLGEDAAMFAGLFEANCHSHEAVRQYRRILNLAASGEIDLLCKRAQWWWEPAQEK